MPDATANLKKKLAISPCKVEKNGNVTVGSKSFEAMLNPSSFNHKHTISYSKRKRFGQIASDSKFDGMCPDTVSFDLLLDGTGVAGAPTLGATAADVKTQLKALNDIVYKYDGSKHEPNVVQVLWGSLIFVGRLTSQTVDYNLFKPSGDPLRAKVSLSFVGFMSTEEQVLRANQQSADVSHWVVVKAGDTLPLLCYRIYKDSSYYPEVARHNKLTDFRNIKPGTRLLFPPLR